MFYLQIPISHLTKSDLLDLQKSSILTDVLKGNLPGWCFDTTTRGDFSKAKIIELESK